MGKRERLLNLILPFITVLFIILVWVVASFAVGSKYVLPSVKETFFSLIELLKSGEFYISLSLTLLRSFISFVLSFVLATVLAFLSKKYFVAKKLVSPLIGIMRALPTVAVVLLILFWTNSFVAPVIVTMLVVLPTVFANTEQSFSLIDGKVLEMCKVFNVPEKEVLFKVKIPMVMPSLIKIAGTTLSLNIKLMVAAEVLASTSKSIGNLLNYSNVNLLTAQMLALVVITVLISIGIEKIFDLISKKVGKWQ